MFKICKIIVESKQESDNLKECLGGYPVDISEKIPDDLYFDIPTLMVGWNSVKDYFPSQKIANKKIKENLFWTYNQSESQQLIEKENYNKNIDDFINGHIISWLPSKYIIYDSIIEGDIYKFIEENIEKEKVSYIHFNAGAIYMRNGEKNIIINVKSLFFTELDYKEVVTNLFNNINCIIYSYDSIEDYVNIDMLKNIKSLDILRWVKFGIETPSKYFQIIPGIDTNKYVPFLMSKISYDNFELNENENKFLERMCVRDKATRWLSTRYVSFSYDFKKNLNFIYREHAKLAQINYSTKRTITGRVTSLDKYNPQNLEKKGDDRKMIVSRFDGGKIYQFDYTSFEAKIALYMTGDGDFIQEFYDKDIHHETAKIIFDTDGFSAEQRDSAKLVNMAIMYGASEATALKILDKYPEPHDNLRKIKNFLRPIFNKASEIVEESKQNGYIINKWGSIIKPEKDFAGFNNYLQSTAADIIIDKVLDIKKLISGYRSQFMFQVHDSLVFDIHPEELPLVQEIIDSMSYVNQMIFTISCKSGINYKELN